MLNHYQTLNTVKKLADQQAEPYTNAWFNVLSQLTEQPELSLYQSSYHRWANILNPYSSPTEFHPQSNITSSIDLTFPLMDIKARSYHLWKFDDVTYCPHCIKENAYHRLYWLPLTTAACLEHKRLLIRGCPNCNQPISITNLVYGTCKKCNFPLHEASSVSVSHDEFGLRTQAMLQFLWGDVPGSFPADRNLLPDKKELKDLFLFFEVLRRAVVYTNGNMTIFHNKDIVNNQTEMSLKRDEMTPAAFFTTSATAFKGLLNWPNGLSGARFSLSKLPLEPLFQEWLNHTVHQ